MIHAAGAVNRAHEGWRKPWWKASRSAGFALGVAAAGLLCAGCLQRWVVDNLAMQYPSVLFCVETEERIVALTIDDGPHPATTPNILEVLRENEARATFFVLGSRVRKHGALTRRIVSEGHELGHHMMHDTPSIELSPPAFHERLQRAGRILSRFTQVRWFRPGSGWFDAPMLETVDGYGYDAALGSVYPYDGALPWPGFAAWYIRAAVFPGAVIILHEGTRERAAVADVLRRVLPALRERGYRIVTLSELIRSAETRGPEGHIIPCN